MPSKGMNIELLRPIAPLVIFMTAFVAFTLNSIFNDKAGFSLADDIALINVHEVGDFIIVRLFGINQGTMQYEIISLSFLTIMISLTTKALVEVRHSKCLKIGFL